MTRPSPRADAGADAPARGLPALPRRLALRTPRLRLEPVTRTHVHELRALYADPVLFAVTGRPRHLGTGLGPWLEAQERRRSPAGSALWLTWALRRVHDGPGAATATGPVVGQVQATVVAGPDGRPQAELSWLVRRDDQGHGLATEAVTAVADWLAGALGVDRLHARVRPGHSASERLAARLGLRPSGEVTAGGRRWTRPVP